MTCLLSGPTKRATDVYGGERRALPEELLATLSHRRVSHGAAPSRRRSTHARRGAAGSRRGGNRVRRAIMGAGNRPSAEAGALYVGSGGSGGVGDDDGGGGGNVGVEGGGCRRQW